MGDALRNHWLWSLGGTALILAILIGTGTGGDLILLGLSPLLLGLIIEAQQRAAERRTKTEEGGSGRWRQFKQALTIQNFGYYFLILAFLMLIFAVGAYVWQGGGGR